MFYHSITQFVFLMNILGKWSDLPFHARAIARRRKARFPLGMCRILFAAKQSWTALCMSRPLFVGSYLQVTWWALGQWTERKFASNDNTEYYSSIILFALVKMSLGLLCTNYIQLARMASCKTAYLNSTLKTKPVMYIPVS